MQEHLLAGPNTQCKIANSVANVVSNLFEINAAAFANSYHI